MEVIVLVFGVNQSYNHNSEDSDWTCHWSRSQAHNPTITYLCCSASTVPLELVLQKSKFEMFLVCDVSCIDFEFGNVLLDFGSFAGSMMGSDILLFFHYFF